MGEFKRQQYARSKLSKRYDYLSWDCPMWLKKRNSVIFCYYFETPGTSRSNFQVLWSYDCFFCHIGKPSVEFSEQSLLFYSSKRSTCRVGVRHQAREVWAKVKKGKWQVVKVSGNGWGSWNACATQAVHNQPSLPLSLAPTQLSASFSTFWRPSLYVAPFSTFCTAPAQLSLLHLSQLS